MQIRSCRCIGDRSRNKSPRSTSSYTKYPRPVTTSPISRPVGLSRTYNKQCRSCAQWRRNAKNRSIRNAARSAHEPWLEPRYSSRVRCVNGSQIRHRKLKEPQWAPLRGTASPFFVVRAKLVALYSTRRAASAILRNSGQEVDRR